jgi:hypothetical protein
MDSKCQANAKKQASQTIKELQTTWITQQKIFFYETDLKMRPEHVKI